jgi:hypothetical protein
MFYDAMIHSHIVYCINVYGCAYTTSLHRLKIKQKEAVRIISNVGYRQCWAAILKNVSFKAIQIYNF